MRHSIYIFILIFLAITSKAYADTKPEERVWKEKHVQACVCKGMQREVVLDSRKRVDCVSDTHAIEVDKTSKWTEAIGQVLHYADKLNMPAKIIFFCKEKRSQHCRTDIENFTDTVDAYGLPIVYDLHGWADLRDACRYQSESFN